MHASSCMCPKPEIVYFHLSITFLILHTSILIKIGQLHGWVNIEFRCGGGGGSGGGGDSRKYTKFIKKALLKDKNMCMSPQAKSVMFFIF